MTNKIIIHAQQRKGHLLLMEESRFSKEVLKYSQRRGRERGDLGDSGEIYEAGTAMMPKPWSE